MKKQTLISFVLGASLGGAVAAVPEGWSTNLTAALGAANAQQQPVLVYFTASWCGPCKLLARTTLTNETVLTALTNLPHVALDIDEHPGLAAKHSVQAVPTFEMLTPAGTAVARVTGYRDASAFLQWLTNSTGEAAAAVARQKQVEERFVALGQLLATTTNSDAARQAASGLFDLCAETEEGVRKPATAALKRLAERDATLLLDGLNHPRLAARIEVANLLRIRLGETFDVDPWSDAQTREKGVSLWREKLAVKLESGKTP